MKRPQSRTLFQKYTHPRAVHRVQQNVLARWWRAVGCDIGPPSSRNRTIRSMEECLEDAGFGELVGSSAAPAKVESLRGARDSSAWRGPHIATPVNHRVDGGWLRLAVPTGRLHVENFTAWLDSAIEPTIGCHQTVHTGIWFIWKTIKYDLKKKHKLNKFKYKHKTE